MIGIVIMINIVNMIENEIMIAIDMTEIKIMTVTNMTGKKTTTGTEEVERENVKKKIQKDAMENGDQEVDPENARMINLGTVQI